ncbi:MFS transporter [Paenibacillus chondroitinus]|uniref:MFS transporter n=1 Tax=Paenibacillus chondroitinus TaxID=59842 RepID=A0ABU6DA67_9BACL|nr:MULTISPECIES: MFS transporter [Paenibacillus]MCY9662326.1 MFS transporter [Paenibacillus anseongense]MEB4794635.1 MFS transporter [Paenibacillus chondroitinus]
MNKKNKLSKQQRFLIFSLFLLTFVLGTSEFAIVGLLNEIATDLGITIASVGTLVSGFAVSFAIGTPIVTALLSRFNKYPLMVILISFFIIGNVISALSDTYVVLFLSRILTAIAEGVLVAYALNIGTNDMIPNEKKGFALSMIFSGFTFSSVIGVPLGTYIGQVYGWHVTFWSTSTLGVIALIISMIIIPRNIMGVKSSIKNQVGLLIHPQFILAFLIPALSIAATFIVYTYLIPIMDEVLSIPLEYVSLILLLYGIVSVFSNMLGGKIARKNGISKLRYIFILQAIILASFYVTAASVFSAMISILLMSLVVFVQGSTSQIYFVELAEKHFPAARDLAASLTPVSINFGIAIGSAMGGIVVTNVGLIHVSWVGGIFALAASFVTIISYRLNQRVQAKKSC